MTLADLIGRPQWVAWQNEERDGKLTKVPYTESDRRAQSDNPATWLTHDRAAVLAERIVNGSGGGGGVGLMLGQCGDAWLAGVDLDSCRDSSSGDIAPWAMDVLRRLDTYAEVSPSSTGVKAFMQVNAAAIGALRTLMGTQHGKSWRRANGSNHPPAIEIHISNRYFATTWEHLDEFPGELRIVPLDTLRWLIEEAGPTFKGKAAQRQSEESASARDDILARLDRAAQHNRAITTALRNAATMHGGSRSEGALALGCALIRAGWSYVDMTAALLACPPTRGWATEKLAEGERQFQRIWEKAQQADAADAEQPAPPAEPEPEPLDIDDAAWAEAEIPRRPWVAPGYALRGAVTLLCGAPSALKSSLVLAWATAIAMHRPFGGFHPTGAGAVIIYNVEDNTTEQRRRLSAVLKLKEFNATPADICGNVIRVCPNQIGTLVTRDRDGKIGITPAMQKLDQLIGERRPAMVIVDPLAELHTSEENDNTALRAVIATFRELAVKHNIAVVILHHTRKDSAASPGDPDTARGASAIIGAARIVLTTATMSEADAKSLGMPTDFPARARFVRLDDAKSNYAPIREAQWFEKAPIGLDNGETVPAASPWIPPKAKIASADDLAALVAAIARGSPSGEPWSPKLSKDQRSIRPLLEQHGFVGTDAQKPILDKLEADHGMQTAQYRRPNRVPAIGLRVDGTPAADWISGS